MSNENPCMIDKAISDANITVSIMGLAVSNYNDSSKRWETIFLRDIPTHELKLTINKCRNGSPVEAPTIIENIHPDERFFIRVNRARDLGAISVSDGEKSLDYVLDLAGPDLYQNNTNIFETNSTRPFTFLSIADSIFYSQNVPEQEYEVTVGQKTTTRRATEITGADIVCEAGGTIEILTVIQPNLIPTMIVDQDTSYEIIFDNTCNNPPSSGEETDFAHYRTLLKDDVESVTVSEEDGGIKTGSCHRAISSDLGELNSLSDLLRPLV
ncbi:MAG TPA: hypothetical protein VK892_00085 [Pyrinomonadaceae bacterium]|nr:hypothetical protein [Pyrinomonadaceae bacterium]